MPNIVYKVNLVKSDPEQNNNKFWSGSLYDNDDVYCEWGRIGDKGQSKMFPGKGRSFLDSKVNEKKRDGRNGEIGYRELDLVEADVPKGVNQVAVKDVSLQRLASEQIKTGSTEASKLIDYLVKVNAHQITTWTGGQIKYNFDTGLFQTPLGLVSQASIDSARKTLNDIADEVVAGSYGKSLLNLTRDYLMLVPQQVGRSGVDLKEFWSDVQKVQNQNTILDGLEASLAKAKKVDPVVKKDDKPMPSVFDVKLDLVKDQDVIEKIRKFYKKTHQTMHACAHLDVKKVYSVDISSVTAAWNGDGAKMTNIWELWHGTKASNLLSILRGGLVIPPKSSPHVCGRMFADGLYFSDQSTKSLNYAYGYWTGKGATDDNCFMFLCQVAMGNFHVPSGPSQNLPYRGSDSTFAKARISGVQNNEMIVYRCSQANLNYLIEFSPNGR